VLGGHVHSGFISLPVVARQVKDGRVRALAVTSAKRSSALPDVPTLSESGMTGFDVSQWWAILVPRGTSPDIVAKLHTDFVALTKLNEIKANMATLGAEPVGGSAEELAHVIRSDIAKYRKIVKDAKIAIN
jgi:tripartite-type tricarboxylate transporter receptor subunit TctC